MVNTVNLTIFAIILFSRIALKDVFATLKKLQIWHDLPTFLRDKVLSPFRKGFFCETLHPPSFVKIKPSRKFRNLQ